MWDPYAFMIRRQIRELDRLAIQDLGMPGPVLMENAGRGAADIIAEILESIPARVVVVAGAGNNGGDGFVLARHLLNRGVPVRTVLVSDRRKIRGDADLNLRLLKQAGAGILDASTPKRLPVLKKEIEGSDVVVDAIFGTGLTRDVDGHLQKVIEMINASDRAVMALDLPSGLDADTGLPLGACVAAHHTITFGHLKRGLIVYPGAFLAGTVHVVDIGVPGLLSDAAGIDGRMLSEEEIAPLMIPRRPDSHKGDFGHLLIVAGSMGKTGAAALAGRAAMRSGVGLATIVSTRDAQAVIEAKSLEAMADHVLETPESDLDAKALRRLSALMKGKTAFAIGPGLGTARGVSALALKVLDEARVPCVVDADGLNILAENRPDCRTWRFKAPVVLTPHPGEMSRLCGLGTREIQGNRIDTARDFAEKSNVILVLKGAATIIASPEGHVFVNPTGNPGMASGGMGDVLTGLIGSFLAQGMDPLDAARAGVFLHGLAADAASDVRGERGLIASDLLDAVASILKTWESED